MLFDSYTFLFLFLPVAWLGFLAIKRSHSVSVVAAWIFVASLIYYGWNKPGYVLIFLGSITFNYYAALRLDPIRPLHPRVRHMLLIVCITANLLLLGYFKYTNLLIMNLNQLAGFHFELKNIMLPAGISFYTFQQIAYLVDVKRSKTKTCSLLQYLFFITYFPHLAAGPILHKDQIIGQLQTPRWPPIRPEYLSYGSALLFMGLLKKVMIADRIRIYSQHPMDIASHGATLSFFEAWAALLAFGMQIYFDFSGYSDMARGLGYLFGIKIPVNFNSPYKSVNIVDFWRRWHITLSGFLRDYLYIPLGGARNGRLRQYFNLMITMILGGLWHGANWTFLIWGALHGACLCLCHGWRRLSTRWLPQTATGPAAPIGWLRRGWGHGVARTATFLTVTLLWAFFCSPDLNTACELLRSAAGFHGFALPEPSLKFLNIFWQVGDQLKAIGWVFRNMTHRMGWIQLLLCLLVVQLLPNTQEWLERRRLDPATGVLARARPILAWRPTVGWACILAALSAIAIMNLSLAGQFWYYQF